MTTFTDRWREIDDSVRASIMKGLEARTDTSFDADSLLEAEDQLSRTLHLPRVMLTSSATAAAHAVFLRAREDGAESVVLPTHVFPGIAGAAISADLCPKFVEVDQDLVSKTSCNSIATAIEVVHYPFGDVDRATHRVESLTTPTVLTDLSHAPGVVPESIWRPRVLGIGSLGAGKFVSGFEMGYLSCGSLDDLRAIAALGAVRRDHAFSVSRPILTKLRPNPLAVFALTAQLRRYELKRELHAATWAYLAPRLEDIHGVRVVGTTTPEGRLFWRCLLEVESLEGTAASVASAVTYLRGLGIPASRPEYLSDAVDDVNRLRPATATTLPEIRPRYLSLPGFIDLDRRDCDRLLRLLAQGLDNWIGARVDV